MAWLKKWEPENTQFWQDGGSAIAWRTLILTTFSLIASFATWFVMSAVVVRMPGLGFKFDTMQLFWLAAMPGLAGGTLRLIHAFLIPIFGTRMTVTTSTFLPSNTAVVIDEGSWISCGIEAKPYSAVRAAWQSAPPRAQSLTPAPLTVPPPLPPPLSRSARSG